MCLIAAAIPALASAAPFASAAVSAAGAVTSYVGQKQQASSAAKFQAKRFSAVTANALKNYRQQIDTLNQRILQEEQVLSGNARDARQAANQAVGSAVTSAGEGGVAGKSVDVLLNNFAAIAAENDRRIGERMDWLTSQATLEGKSYQTQAESYINAAQPQPVQQPSALALGLNLASIGLGAANDYAQQNALGPYSGTNRVPQTMNRNQVSQLGNFIYSIT